MMTHTAVEELASEHHSPSQIPADRCSHAASTPSLAVLPPTPSRPGPSRSLSATAPAARWTRSRARRPADGGDPRPAGGGREQARRRHQHRGQVADRQPARRLHPAAGRQCAGGQPVAVRARRPTTSSATSRRWRWWAACRWCSRCARARQAQDPARTWSPRPRPSRAAITVATPGNGSTPHLAMELFQHTAGISLRHVPYKGGAPGADRRARRPRRRGGGQCARGAAAGQGGKLRVLAVMSAERSGGAAGRADGGGVGLPGLRGQRLVWLRRAGRPAQAGAGAKPARRGAEGDRVARGARAAGGRRRRVVAGLDATQFDQLLTSEAARYGKLIREANIQARMID